MTDDKLPRWMTFEQRYNSDPTLHAIVDMMSAAIERLQLTPSEMREAAIFACIRVEQRRMRPMLIPIASADEARRNIHELQRFLDDLVPTGSTPR